MNPNELYETLKEYFPNNLDLMRHLDVGACWEYLIYETSIDNENPKLNYFLYKKDANTLKMTKENPEIEPDLILYFTENAILTLIEGHPNAEEYFSDYKDFMENPKSGLVVDNKVNKARLKLWRIGYRNWQKDFNF
jgi:hypothetical protein